MSPTSTVKIPRRVPGVGDAVGGRYRLESILASGGMGIVFRATDLQNDREVAVKLLHPRLIDDPKSVRRFEREIRLAESLRHPNIIRVFDHGSSRDGALYVVMELLEGESLALLIDRDGPLLLDHTCDILLQVLRGLAAAHEAEILHRDIKPSNIFLTPRRYGVERVKLLDFGVAKSLQGDSTALTGTNQGCGTVSYMPPESVFQAELGTPCDIYAVGLIAAEMVLGSQIFQGDNGAQTLLRHVQEPIPVPANVAATPVGDVIRRATAKHPDERYPTAGAMHSALAEAAEQLDETVRPDLTDMTEFWGRKGGVTNSIWPLRPSDSLDILRADEGNTATGDIRNAFLSTTSDGSERSGNSVDRRIEAPADTTASGEQESYRTLREALATTRTTVSVDSLPDSLKSAAPFDTFRAKAAGLAALAFTLGLGWFAYFGLGGDRTSESEETTPSASVSDELEESFPVRTDRTGATVRRDDEPIGSSPLTIDVSLEGEEPDVTLTRVGFESTDAALESANRDESVDVELTPIALPSEAVESDSAGPNNGENKGESKPRKSEAGNPEASEETETANRGPAGSDESPTGESSTEIDEKTGEHRARNAGGDKPKPPPSRKANESSSDPPRSGASASASDKSNDGNSSDEVFQKVARDYALE